MVKEKHEKLDLHFKNSADNKDPLALRKFLAAKAETRPEGNIKPRQ